jgi:hypothetical protein
MTLGGIRRRYWLKAIGPAALIVPASLLVHQLRFTLAFGGGVTAQLQRQGHAYLHSLVPWVVLLLALGVGIFLRALGRACAAQTSWPRYTISFVGLWLACTSCLVAIYVFQELLEGAIASGHPAGPLGVFGYGGWWSIPAALCVGLVLAAVFHGARWALEEVAQRHALQRRLPALDRRLPQAADTLIPRLAPLANGWSGRGPPV